MNDLNQDPSMSPSRGELVGKFTNSLEYDKRLFMEEIAVAVAHTKMLAAQKIISSVAATRIEEALAEIEREMVLGEFQWRDELEDIHMNIESRLHYKIGQSAGLLHTGRSRNDVIATNTRLWAKRITAEVLEHIRALQTALVQLADKHTDTLMPAYTHIQRGQPTVLGHHLLAYYEMLKRDAKRFRNARDLLNELPLGAGAGTGSPYNLNREMVAEELGFARIAENSLDAVSDRDYVADVAYASAVCMMHLSRLSEELVIWSSSEFGFVRMAGAYATGSSIMPQKRNPDFAELIRGRVGKSYGALLNVLTIMKGLPLTYNRDMQEDKAPLFDLEDNLLPCIQAMTGMVASMEVDTERMHAALDQTSILATDMADYLTKKGLPFRQAYLIARELSDKCYAEERELMSLSLKELKAVSPLFDRDFKQLTVESSVASRNLPGGTAPEQVRAQVEKAKKALAEDTQ